MSDKSKTRVITPEAVLSYPHLHQPQAAENGGKPKYSASLIFVQGTSLAALEAAVIEAAKQFFGETVAFGNGRIPVADALRKGVLRSPFRTDWEKKPGYPANCTFINVRTEQQPGMVYSYADPVESEKAGRAVPAKVPADKIREEFYPGARVRASIVAFGYDNNGNKGVGFALNNLQKVGDGERLDGRVAAEQEFDADLSQEPASIDDLV